MCIMITGIINILCVFGRVMFWSENFSTGSKISRANYNGTNEVEVFDGGPAMIEDIVFDADNGI